MDLSGGINQRELRRSRNRGDNGIDPDEFVANVGEVAVIDRKDLPPFGSETWIGLPMQSVSSSKTN
jgi:hypothetical protein